MLHVKKNLDTISQSGILFKVMMINFNITHFAMIGYTVKASH